jgi:hypothetical protein
LEKVQRSGPLLAQQVATFERTHNAHDPISKSFLREAKVNSCCFIDWLLA